MKDTDFTPPGGLLSDYPSNGQEGEDTGSAISQVEAGLSLIDEIPEGTQSLLSPKILNELAIASIAGEESMASVFLTRAAPHMHTTDGLVDFATTVCIGVSRGEIKSGQSMELRKWAELMYTCIVANSAGQSNVQVNYVEQLIQLAGGEGALQGDILDVTSHKKAQGE